MIFTPLYAAFLAVWLVILSVRVIALRGNPVFSAFAFKHAGDDSLERAIRAHGNFTEYTPYFLILLFLAEMLGSNPIALNAIALSFTIGRIMHGICFSFMARNLFLRVGGTILTLFPLLGLASQILRSYL